jgi:hypothetical protein
VGLESLLAIAVRLRVLH